MWYNVFPLNFVEKCSSSNKNLYSLSDGFHTRRKLLPHLPHLLNWPKYLIFCLKTQA